MVVCYFIHRGFYQYYYLAHHRAAIRLTELNRIHAKETHHPQDDSYCR